MRSKKSSRRQFLKKSSVVAAGVSMPYFFSAKPGLAFETSSKNDRVPIGLIGAGGMGLGNMRAASKWVDVVAIADADKTRQEAAKKHTGGKADLYDDYREILERDDIKVLHIATPDHWHTKPLIEAMLAGKDVYCEKPLTLTIDEGKLIRRIQEETGRVVQVGTQQRSTFNLFVKAIAIVKDGRIGKINRLTASIGGAPSSDALPVADVPEGLDWDRWLGPAPAVEYRQGKKKGKRAPSNCHYEFRWWYEYSGGKLTDWGAHHVDIAAWALEANGQSNSVISLDGTAEHPVEYKDGVPQQTDCYNTATKFNYTAKFAEDVEMVIQNGPGNGVLIEGEKGRIFVNRGKLTGKPVEDLKDNPLPEDAIKETYKGFEPIENGRAAHWANFLKCVDERKEPISDVHSHMRMLNICHLTGIAARLGRGIKWDDKTEQIVGDDVANSMLKRPYREGYEINMEAPKPAAANS